MAEQRFLDETGLKTLWADILKVAVPKIETTQAGYILTVNSDGTSCVWAPVSGSVPSVDANVSGYVLTVSDDGTSYSWRALPDIPVLPATSTSNAGYVLCVNSTGTGYEWKDPSTLTSSTSSAKENTTTESTGEEETS